MAPTLDAVRGKVTALGSELKKGVGDLGLNNIASRVGPALSATRGQVEKWRGDLQNDVSRNGFDLGLSKLTTDGVRDTLSGSASAAIAFASNMADVRKAVYFDTPEQFRQMGKDVLALSERLPVSAEGITKIVAAAGAAGIARDELLAFSGDVVKMGVAFDLTAEESGAAMAQWRNSLRLTQSGAVALADQIGALSGSSAVSARDIANIVSAVGPLGEMAGSAAGQIAAMGATLAGAGVRQDVAAAGIQGLVQAMTAGSSATLQQQQAFQSLGLDAKAMADTMRTDAGGAITQVLEAIGKVDPSQQSDVLSKLFGGDSAAAIAPMLGRLDELRKSFRLVGDASQYAGAMEQGYTANSANLQNGMQISQNLLSRLNVSFGSALVFAINNAALAFAPLISWVSTFVSEHPNFIAGVLGAAAALIVIQRAIMLASVAMQVLSMVTTMSPVGIIVRLIAMAAGILIANWSSLPAFFSAIWQGIADIAAEAWEAIKAVFNWSALGLIVANWSIISEYLGMLWQGIKDIAAMAWEGVKTVFSWSPLGLIISNWDPIVAWLKDLYERVRPYIEPMLNAGSWIGGKLSGLLGGGNDATVGNPSLAQQTQAGNRSQLDGALVVRFENAPAGLRPEPASSNQPGLNIFADVGYRSLAGAY